MTQILDEFRDRIVAASSNKTALCIRGGGSKDWYGNTSVGERFETRAYAGIVAYDPTELVITARCGTPLSEIEAALDEHHQMLAFEPPYFGDNCTIGGVVASGLAGPRRAAVGAVRDFLLGAVLMDGKGDALTFGGQVMKNVAGYDVSRMLAGSMGILGVILEVSLKVLPKPFAETSLRFAMNQHDAIRQLNEWSGQALPISASVWHDGLLSLRLSGADAAVKAAQQKCGGTVIEDGVQFWCAVREQCHPFFTPKNSSEQALWRLSLPSVAAPISLAGASMIEWGGAQRWLYSDADPKQLRAIAEVAGGHATQFKGGDKSGGVFHPLTAAVAQIHRNLKLAFDPAGIFNPGRLIQEL